MATYSPDITVLTINGRQITAFGQTADPITHSPIAQHSTLIQGQGGGSTRVNRSNPGRTMSVFLLPGTSDSAYLQGLMRSNANITASLTVIGTLETVIGTEGMITGDGPVNRGGGEQVGDDQYDFSFNIWEQTKGGE